MLDPALNSDFERLGPNVAEAVVDVGSAGAVVEVGRAGAVVKVGVDGRGLDLARGDVVRGVGLGLVVKDLENPAVGLGPLVGGRPSCGHRVAVAAGAGAVVRLLADRELPREREGRGLAQRLVQRGEHAAGLQARARAGGRLVAGVDGEGIAVGRGGGVSRWMMESFLPGKRRWAPNK